MQRVKADLTWATLPLLLSMACADQAQDGTQAPSALPLERGDKTFDMPAIGRTINKEACTATLINPRVILTAAHCFQFDATKSGFGDDSHPPSLSSAPSGTIFRIEDSAGATHDFDVHRFALYDTAYGPKDIAVAELASDVPDSIATPLTFASYSPNDGDPVTVWGYGASTGTYTSAGWTGLTFPDGRVKRHINDTWNAGANSGNASVGCPGDSGGPLLNSANEVVAVLSAGDCTGGGDLDDRANVATAALWVGNAAAIYGRAAACKWCTHFAAKTENGHYLQAVNGGGAAVTAEPTEAGSWETWRLVELGGPYIALQTENGNFLSATGGGGSGVSADRELLGTWETFFTVAQSQMTLRTLQQPYYYVSAVDGGGGAVTADKPELGTWESFDTEWKWWAF